MRLRLLTLLLGLMISGFAVAQKTIEDYHYILVPDQFEFLKGKDQYQVNSLVRFLFKKHGFNAYIGDELPIYLRKQPCKGLYADVQGSENFMATKITINIKDCYGTILFSSQEGLNRDKDYRKAYHGAVREAFISIEELNIKQTALPELTADTQPLEGNDEKPKEEAEKEQQVIFNTDYDPVSASGVGEVPKEKPIAVEVAAAVSIVSMTYQDYEIIKDGTSYKIMYKGELIGSANPTAEEGVFTVETSQFTGKGFEGEEAFRIERNIEGLDQTVTMLFKPKE